MSVRRKAAARRVGRPGNGGDVREAVLTATLRQLEEGGSPDRVTVAAIVAEAGCTPPSLYHYWPTRELLLQEASARGWAQFRASQAAAVQGSTSASTNDRADPERPGALPGSVIDEVDDPVTRLRLRGRAYLDFALAKPALFRVLFLEPVADSPTPPPTSPPTPAPTGPMPERSARPPAGPAPGTGKALDDLVNDVIAAMAAGQLRTGDPLTTALALWSSMHGVASLWAVTPSLPVDLAHAVGNLAQDAVLSGLLPAPEPRPGPEG